MAELVQAQAGCTAAEAAEALAATGGDVVDAIMWLSTRDGPEKERRTQDDTEVPGAEKDPQSASFSFDGLDLVVVATGVSRGRAEAALRECGGDVVNALLMLSTPTIPSRKPKLKPGRPNRGATENAAEDTKTDDGDYDDDNYDEEEEEDDDVDAFAAGLSSRLKVAQNRVSVAKEILSSEKQYMRALFVLRDVYLNPLVRLSDDDPPLKSLGPLLDALEKLIPVSAGLHSELHQCVQSWTEASCIAKCFPSASTFEDIYFAYNESAQAVMKDLHQLNKQMPELADRLKRIRADAVPDTQELNSYVIQPVQRLPRYELLLRQMLASTVPDQAGPLIELLQGIQQTNCNINERMRRKAQSQQMRALAKRFTTNPGFGDDELLLKEGHVQKRSSKGRMEKRVLLLLNTSLAYAKLTSRDMLMLSVNAPLRKVRINDVPDSGKDKFRFEIAIVGGKKFLVALSSLEEKMDWMLAISNATAKDMLACKSAKYRQ